MFSAAKKGSDFSLKNYSLETLITPASTIEGSITSSDVIKVNGKILGDIISHSKVIIEESGFVKGNILAIDAIIYGVVEGNINCSGLLELLGTAKLSGDIHVNSISISPGALFKGDCHMSSYENTDLDPSDMKFDTFETTE